MTLPRIGLPNAEKSSLVFKDAFQPPLTVHHTQKHKILKQQVAHFLHSC